MITRDEQGEEYSVKSKRKKKTSTKENCLPHCREDWDFDDIVKFSETSWTISSQLVLKACAKRKFLSYSLFAKRKSQFTTPIFYYFQTVKEASEIRQDNVFSTEAIPTGSRGYHRKCYQSHKCSKALMKFRPPIIPDIESKRSSTRLISPGEGK